MSDHCYVIRCEPQLIFFCYQQMSPLREAAGLLYPPCLITVSLKDNCTGYIGTCWSNVCHLANSLELGSSLRVNELSACVIRLSEWSRITPVLGSSLASSVWVILVGRPSLLCLGKLSGGMT